VLVEQNANRAVHLSGLFEAGSASC
jgi:hypothetical protein